jgi:hypothetical protein
MSNLELLCTDVLQYITIFLTNKDTINLLCTKKYIYLSLINRGNIYNTITIHHNMTDLFYIFKKYLSNQNSIKVITFNRMLIYNDTKLPDIWPFDTTGKIIKYLYCKYI